MLTIYKASAGSGKTYNLAKSYILLLIANKKQAPQTQAPQYTLNLWRDENGIAHLVRDYPHRCILAITFTRKATDEMKQRIISELENLADPNADSDFARDFNKEYGWRRQDMADVADLALTRLLYDYHYFNVSTIDSFFQTVMRTFARELDFQNDYNIELRDRIMMQAAIDLLLDTFNQESAEKHSEFEEWLSNFLYTEIEDGKKANFFNRKSQVHKLLVTLISKISEEQFKEYSDEMEEYLKEKRIHRFAQIVHARRQQLKKQIIDLAKSTFGPGKIDTALLVYRGAIKTKNIIDDLIEKDTMPTQADFLDAIKSNHGYNAFIDDKDKTKLSKDISPVEEATALACLRKIGKALTDYFSFDAVILSIRQLGLLSYAWGFLKKFKEENNVILLSDTNHTLSAIIGEDEAPFIYEKMGVQLKHFLIDEFQDTSAMQWQNLRPLVSNGLSEGGESLVIGDEKQSIYRFRNSDSSILGEQVGQDFKGRKREKGDIPEENTNFRSSPDVVKFNNTLFSAIARAQKVGGFGNVVQGIHKTHPGLVKLKPFKVGRSGSIDKDEIFKEMAQTILRQIKEGKFEQGDIAILTDKNAQGAEIAEFLVKNYPQINLYSDEALLLESSSAVKRVISILRIIDQEQTIDDTVGATSRYPTRAEAALAMNRYSYFINQAVKAAKGEEFTPEMEAEVMVKALNPQDQDNINLSDSISDIREKKPASLLAYVETVIQCQLTEEERNNHSAYLAALQDAVLDFESDDSASLHSFLDWWDDHSKNLSLVSDASANGVRIMTVHKSKGLEFHCVYIPLCIWKTDIEFGNHAPDMWTGMPQQLIDSLKKTNAPDVDENIPPRIYIKMDKLMKFDFSPYKHLYDYEANKVMEDQMNKTYVAFTRAKTELHVWYAKPSEAKSGQEPTPYIGRLIDEAVPQCQNLSDPLLCPITRDADGCIVIGNADGVSKPIKNASENDEETKIDEIFLPYKVWDIGDKRRFVTVDNDDEDEDE